MSLSQNMQTATGASPAFFLMGTEGSFPRIKRSGLEANHLPPHLEPRSRKSGVIPPLLPHTFMVYKEMTLPLLLYDFR